MHLLINTIASQPSQNISEASDSVRRSQSSQNMSEASDSVRRSNDKPSEKKQVGQDIRAMGRNKYQPKKMIYREKPSKLSNSNTSLRSSPSPKEDKNKEVAEETSQQFPETKSNIASWKSQEITLTNRFKCLEDKDT